MSQVNERFFLDILPVSPFVMNCGVLGCQETKKAAIIDPGAEEQRILHVAERAGFEITHILLTHGHIDHVAATGAVKKATGAPIHLHRDDRELYEHVSQQARAFGMNADVTMPPVDVFVGEGDTVQVGALTLEVRHAPGHSPGSVCFYLAGDPGLVFAGDVLFAGSIGRTDLWGGSYEVLMRSIGERLMTMPDDTQVYSGHGPMTTIGAERTRNPFSGDFATPTT